MKIDRFDECYIYCTWIKPANPASSSKDNELWSEDETGDHNGKNPIPTRQIRSKDLLAGIGFSACVQVAEAQPCNWGGVDEGCQHPGQKLKAGDLGGTWWLAGADLLLLEVQPVAAQEAGALMV